MAVAVRGCPAKSPVKGHLVQGMMRFPDALQVLLYSIETKCLVHRNGEIKVRESKMCVLVQRELNSHTHGRACVRSEHAHEATWLPGKGLF